MKIARETKLMLDVALRAASLAAKVGEEYPAQSVLNDIAVCQLTDSPLDLDAIFKARDSDFIQIMLRIRSALTSVRQKYPDLPHAVLELHDGDVPDSERVGMH